MERDVLTVIFEDPSEFVAQEAHLARGALFVPAPDPLPEPFATLVLRVEAPTGGVVELDGQVLQIAPRHIAVAPKDLETARRKLGLLIDAARRMARADGATWVFWGRPDSAGAPTPTGDSGPPAGLPIVQPGEAQQMLVDAAAAVRFNTVPAGPPVAVDGEDSIPKLPIVEPASWSAPVEPAATAEGGELLYDTIRAMGSQEKMRLALHGDRPARLVLLKDVNKSIQTFLLQNPRITTEEVRFLATSRQASPDALLAIAAHRDWGQNASIVAALIRNPKTPAPTAVKLLDKVPPAELRRIARTGDAPQAVTAAARKRCADP